MSLVVEGHVEDLLVHPVRRVAVERHYFYILPEGVLIASFLEFFLFGGETLDDFLDCSPFGWSLIERPFLRAGDGRRDQKQGSKHHYNGKPEARRRERKSGAESHNVYSNESGAGKFNGSLHLQSRPCKRPIYRRWKTAVLPIHFDATVGTRFAIFTILYGESQRVRVSRIALPIPHSTNPGSNWYSLMTGIIVQGTTTSRFRARYPR